MDWIVLALVSTVAGGIASVTGFGIGSLLTPLLAMRYETKLAVAAISIPHFLATAMRCWMLRDSINKKVLVRFGIASAVGGLTGAVLHNFVHNSSLTIIFGIVLIFAGFIGSTGLSDRIRFKGPISWVAGALSGGLGGLVGNQGGIRSAALLGFDLQPNSFVATATAIGVVVDLSRVPVYLCTQGEKLAEIWPAISIAGIGVIAGTFGGTGLLRGLDPKLFKRTVSVFIFMLGIWMLFQHP